MIAEGLNGRTTAFPKTGLMWKSGLYAVEPILASHYPIDTLVVMLGTNDCAAELELEASDIANGMEKLLVTARDLLLEKQGFEPRIILICPPHLEKSIMAGPFAEEMNRKSIETSSALPEMYGKLAKKLSCDYLDLDGKIRFSEIDSEHLRPFDSYRLAGMLAEMIIE